MADKISITICGDGGCGKSSITLRLVRSQWTHEYDPTIEDSYSVTRNVDGLPYFLSLTDTAGQEEYRGLWAASNLKSDAFLLVYDITNPNSLGSLDYFLDMIEIEAENRLEDNHRLMKEAGMKKGSLDRRRLSGLQAPPVKIVAGNKCDLKDMRLVTSRQGLEWARGKGCGFMETSAREMVNIEESFALIVRRVVEARRLVAEEAAGGHQTSPYKHLQTGLITSGQPPSASKDSPNASSSPAQRQNYITTTTGPGYAATQRSPTAMREKDQLLDNNSRRKAEKARLPGDWDGDANLPRWKKVFRKLSCRG